MLQDADIQNNVASLMYACMHASPKVSACTYESVTALQDLQLSYFHTEVDEMKEMCHSQFDKSGWLCVGAWFDN